MALGKTFLNAWLCFNLLTITLNTNNALCQNQGIPSLDTELGSLAQSEKWNEALSLLQKHPKGNASYYYDLGTVFLKLGKTGTGLAYLEKANTLKRHDSQIHHNLRLGRSLLEKQLGHENLDPASSWKETLADWISTSEAQGGFGLLAFLLILVWVKSYLKTQDLKKTFSLPSGISGISGVLIVLLLIIADRYAAANPQAVCLTTTSARSGPGNQFLRLAQVEAGVKLRLLGVTQQNGESPPQTWAQIRFSSDEIGWIPISDLLPL